MDKHSNPPPRSSVACFTQEIQSALIQKTQPQFQPMEELPALQKEQRHPPSSWEIPGFPHNHCQALPAAAPHSSGMLPCRTEMTQVESC